MHLSRGLTYSLKKALSLLYSIKHWNLPRILAYQILYRAIQQKTERNPLSLLRQAIRGVRPDIAVKARRVGGSTHQVPNEIEVILLNSITLKRIRARRQSRLTYHRQQGKEWIPPKIRSHVNP